MSGRLVNLMPRDLQLMAAVGIARYLSTEQIARLFFPGTVGRASAWRRLGELERAAGGAGRSGYVRRAEGVAFSGERYDLWSLTARGAAAVEGSLGLAVRAVERELSAQFLGHQARLSDLFVGLVERHAPRGGEVGLRPRKGRRAMAFAQMRLPFRWLVSDAARLPWREFDVSSGSARNRFIAPDATLEVGGRRIFVEMETGSQPITAADSRRRGATAQKLDAYDGFINGFEDAGRKRTFYSARFGDSLRPEVLFVVESSQRALNVNELIAAHRAAARGVAVRAMVVDAAVAHLSEAVGPAVPVPAATQGARGGSDGEAAAVSPAEIAALWNLWRAYSSWRKSAKEAGQVRPDQPEDIRVAYDALLRLRGLGSPK